MSSCRTCRPTNDASPCRNVRHNNRRLDACSLETVSSRPRMLLERWRGDLAVTGIALVIAVGEPRCKFSQIALPDWLAAQRTERLRAGCPAIHQDKFHMPPPRSVWGSPIRDLRLLIGLCR